MPDLRNDETQPDSGTDWRLFEIHKASMEAVGKAQGRFVNALLSYLAILWGWWLMRPSDMTVDFPLVKLNPAGLWALTPAVLTVLSLSLIGSLNIMGPVWKRLSDSTDRLEQKVFFTDLDVNKNVIDYLVYLRIRPEGPVEPTKAPIQTSRKWSLYVFSYPLLLLFSIASTFLADYKGAPASFRLYVYGCGFLQVLFSVRIWYRAFCRFLGIRREQTEI